MAGLNPPPRSLDIIPHEVTQDSPFDGSNINPLPVLPDSSFDDWVADDTAAAVAMLGCDDNCLKACIVAASVYVWGVWEIFLAQLDTVYRLLHPMHPNHLAVIQQTGARKTHILQMLGGIERGIVLIFIPLLTLSANVMSKFTCTDQRFGAVTIQYLDKLYDANKQVYKDLLQHCQGLLCSTITTVFIFLSLQFVINHPDACDVFIGCSHRATLCVVAIDEAHFHIQDGTLFRSMIRALQALFFAEIFGNQPHLMRLRLIVLTATMPTSYLLPLSHLLTINLFFGDLLVCGTQNRFRQCKIDIGVLFVPTRGCMF
jgi:hypothetical protein